jgi:hypothetical protein
MLRIALNAQFARCDVALVYDVPLKFGRRGEMVDSIEFMGQG